MKIKTNYLKPACLLTMLSFCGVVSADVIIDPVVTTGMTVTINRTDTANLGIVDAPFGSFNKLTGNLVNYGQIYSWGELYINNIGTLENFGDIFIYSSLTQSGILNPRVINHPSGNIIISGYLSLQSSNSIFENAGRVTVIPPNGDKGSTNLGFTNTQLRGSMKNTGVFTIDNHLTEDNCDNRNWSFTITNEGLFEVGKGSTCDFYGSPAQGTTTNTGTKYTQTKGETIVNGVFGAHSLVLAAGKLSGSGVVKRIPANLSSKLSISPGSPGLPIGKLTLIPETGITTFGGTLNIELSPEGNDELHVEGELYMSAFSKINVTLADGLKLKKGDSFTIITGSYVEFNGADLPALPFYLKWDIVQNGTSVKLNVI